MLTGAITESMDNVFAGLPAEDLLGWASEEFESTLVMSTSFGIQSAVTLHLATQIKPDIPVIWVDTGYLPKETVDYANTLTELLNLNLHVAKSEIPPALMEITYGRLWESDNVEDLNLYDEIRKVVPMKKMLRKLNATGWISGVRADQTEHRSHLPRVKREGIRYRIYPILEWSNRDIFYYMQKHNLPQHPLFDKGYTTVGDAHSSRPLSENDIDDRATRFNGRKQECGLHLYDTAIWKQDAV